MANFVCWPIGLDYKLFGKGCGLAAENIYFYPLRLTVFELWQFVLEGGVTKPKVNLTTPPPPNTDFRYQLILNSTFDKLIGHEKIRQNTVCFAQKTQH